MRKQGAFPNENVSRVAEELKNKDNSHPDFIVDSVLFIKDDNGVAMELKGYEDRRPAEFAITAEGSEVNAGYRINIFGKYLVK